MTIDDVLDAGILVLVRVCTAIGCLIALFAVCWFVFTVINDVLVRASRPHVEFDFLLLAGSIGNFCTLGVAYGVATVCHTYLEAARLDRQSG